jgi:hypothetical protein
LSTVLEQQEFGGVINALIIGDRSLISTKHWALFQATNTTHLSVISGLHIGLTLAIIKARPVGIENPAINVYKNADPSPKNAATIGAGIIRLKRKE